MPIPFAEIEIEGSGVANLQLWFWRNAVERFLRMEESVADYDEEADFFVEASTVIVLAGTSVSQLLGQQWRSGNVKLATEGDGQAERATTFAGESVRGLTDLATSAQRQATSHAVPSHR